MYENKQNTSEEMATVKALHSNLPNNPYFGKFASCCTSPLWEKDK